jgi:hypothetical protein
MVRYGFDYAILSDLPPRLTNMSVMAFGNCGPEHDQPGFDGSLERRERLQRAAFTGERERPSWWCKR